MPKTPHASWKWSSSSNERCSGLGIGEEKAVELIRQGAADVLRKESISLRLAPAVRRELAEEASVKVTEVTYYATQPWPFPSSLMIGCFAKAASRDVKPDENEIAELRWLERSVARELIAGKRRDGIQVPPPIAIAHHLIKAWALGQD